MKGFLTSAILCLSVATLSVTGKEHDSCVEFSGGDLTLRAPSPDCNCSKALIDQVKSEFEASFTYLAMAAHFRSEANFRPGVSKFFWDSANEERKHGKEIMKYGLMRGFVDVFEPLGEIEIDTSKVNKYNVLQALTKALELEKKVTADISKIIKTCDECNDGDKANADNYEYHISDYLTGEFLTEQVEGMRKIGEYITTLERMKGSPGILKELLFDKTLPRD